MTRKTPNTPRHRINIQGTDHYMILWRTRMKFKCSYQHIDHYSNLCFTKAKKLRALFLQMKHKPSIQWWKMQRKATSSC